MAAGYVLRQLLWNKRSETDRAAYQGEYPELIRIYRSLAGKFE